MTLTVDELTSMAEYTGRGYIEIREDYSGRCMYGETVPAVICDEDIRVELLEAADALGIAHNKSPSRIDSMGMNVVIY